MATVPGTAPSTVAATTSTTAAAVPTTTTTTTTTQSGPAPCATSQLAASLTSPNGAAGTVYYQLDLRNTGASPCTIVGYPGVSFVASPGGQQVGAAAARTSGATPTLTLSTGQSASAQLGITDATNFGTPCGFTPVDAIRVFPPGQTAPLYVTHRDTACSNPSDGTLRIGPLTG